MSARIIRVSALAVLVLFPTFSFAQVSITEIFYSPQHSSWVEIYNTSSTSVDLSTYKILDSGAPINGHGITSVSGGLVLPLGYAIIAKDPSTFIASTYPIYKAALSMKVSGDTLILKDASGKVADEVVFTSSEGGAGDGNSLQRVGTGWQALVPTPGADASEAIQTKLTSLQSKIIAMTSNTTFHAGLLSTSTNYKMATSNLLLFSDQPMNPPPHHWWDAVLHFFGL